MSEPQTGTRHTLGSWLRGFLEVLGGIAALAGILALVLDVQERFKILERDRYRELLEIEDRYKQGELIAKADCPVPEASPPRPSDPWMDRATILISSLDDLVQEAGFLMKNIGEPDFFGRFDRWRSSARSKLADGQKLIREAGWSSQEDWEGTFHSQTHIKRDMLREPYRPEELRGFLDEGSRVLAGMKSALVLHAGKPASSPELSGLPEGRLDGGIVVP